MAENVESNTSLNSETSDTAVSMLDVLADERKLEEDANAVLGDSDDKNCTYFMGYVSRQALYSCMTCVDPNKSVSAGVCLACSLECHDGHDLVELYTKRNFRCDCGNSKFGGFKCKLSDKAPANDDNLYNQNFKGKYCTCARPYPDPEDDTEDDMIQCIACEDWFHGRHLISKVPDGDDYDEMICSSCMARCDFLWPYTGMCTGAKNYILETSPKKANGDGSPAKSPKKDSPKEDDSPKPGSSKADSKHSTCKRSDLEKLNVMKHKGATFWPEHWRKQLCKCDDCMNLYDKLKVTFLLDETDSIKAYEERGRSKAGNQYESGLQALSGMDRHQQVEMLHGYNDMKSALHDYLKKFADNGKVVREEDIKEFFEEFKAMKKQKRTPAPQYYCK